MDNRLKQIYYKREQKALNAAKKITLMDKTLSPFFYDISWIIFNALGGEYKYRYKERARDFFYKRKFIKKELNYEKHKILFIGDIFINQFYDDTIKWNEKQKGSIQIAYKEHDIHFSCVDKKKVKEIIFDNVNKNAQDVYDKIMFYINKRRKYLYNLGKSFEILLDKTMPETIVFQHDRRKEYFLFVDIARKKGIKTIVFQHGLTPYKEYVPMADLSYYPLYADEIFVWGDIAYDYFMAKGIELGRIKKIGHFRWKEFNGFNKNPQYKIFIQQQFIGLKEWESDIKKIISPFLQRKDWMIKGRNKYTDIDLKGKYLYGDIKDAIQIAEIGITPFSAGAIEFLFSGVPVVLITPYNEDIIGLYDLVPHASSAEELENILKEQIDLPNKRELERRFGKSIDKEEFIEKLDI